MTTATTSRQGSIKFHRRHFWTMLTALAGLSFGLSSCKTRDTANTSLASSTSSLDTDSVAFTAHGKAFDRSGRWIPTLSDEQVAARIFSEPDAEPTGSRTSYALAEDPGAAYVDRCMEAGVPIPPAWGDAGWVSRGNIPIERSAFGRAFKSNVLWTYESDQGTCAALERASSLEPQAKKTIGIICQAHNGNSCFWDNFDRRNKKRTNAFHVRELANPLAKIEDCSECHRGENAFIVYKDTNTAKLPTPDKVFQPVGPWENPMLPAATAPKCQTCHALPKPTTGYCYMVLKPSLPFMPSREADKGPYADDIRALLKHCS